MKIPTIEMLKAPELLRKASHYSAAGKLAVSTNQLVYLDVEDAYVHQLYPLIQTDNIQKPDYFKEDSSGAHISVFYPEEKASLLPSTLGEVHRFTIRDLVAAHIGRKIYYALMVESASLLMLRRKHRLPDLLDFKGYAIGFHITIGVEIT